ncbi:MAG: signal recognition particle receptor subunit alpha [Candidatus Aenigmarchaeota archaeon]|nr:signal recognition particle receptor subunit alpha [Candidatus Aenigmarchaeota archaeon]
MLKGLSDKLRESLEKLARLGLVDTSAVEDLVRDIQRSLISADVDVELVFQLSENIRKRSFEKIPAGLSRKEHVIKVVYEELTKILGEKKSEIELKPKKILLVGLFGSGKTTCASKLARFYQKKGLKPAMICCDVVRPAAYEQLEQLAHKIDVPFFGIKAEKDSSKVLKDSMSKARADVLIVDSSGRSALDKDLIDEIKKLNEILQPDERILVIPADIGQAAREQANAFHAALGITDVIVTKMDATAKGGGALTACYETGAKVKFISVGETPEDLELYDPEKFVARLIGFPDLETLLEKARAVVDEKKAEKLIKGDFDLDDFYSQIESMQKMGPVSQMLDMMGMGKLGAKVPGGLDVQEAKMKKWKFIIQSMTPEEKANPDIINSSRVARIANGSGCKEPEVRELVANYNKVKKMMKKISPAKLKRGGLGGIFKQFGNMM